jgi:hypothetical protein
LLTHVASLIKPLKAYADSIYIKAFKNGSRVSDVEYIDKFLNNHSANPGDNLISFPLHDCADFVCFGHGFKSIGRKTRSRSRRSARDRSAPDPRS